MVLISRSHVQSVKRLYKIIFKLHKSLPEEMRQIGDSYVRNEFRLHKNSSPDIVKLFMLEWGVIIL
jgi:hypothetical protein